MTIAYFDCFSGVAGDMLNAAMLDAGMPLKYLQGELKKLGLPGYTISTTKERRKDISGTLYWVDIQKSFPSPDADKLKRCIAKSRLNTAIKEQSLKILETILGAEKKVFGLKGNKLYFGEKEAVDLLVDIVGSVIGFDYFKFKQIFASPLPMHRCFRADVLEILKGMPVEKLDRAQSLVTPTGASVLKTVVDHFGESPLQKIKTIGTGCGHRSFSTHPNVLRLMIGEGFPAVAIEANIDDMNPQWFGFVMEKLFAAGCVDVFLQPIQMKKNRPAVSLKAMAPWDLKDKVIEIILRETTTLGIRYYPVERRIFSRELKTVSTKFGSITVKAAHDHKLGIKKFVPEYESCRKAARQKKIPIRLVYEEVLRRTKS